MFSFDAHRILRTKVAVRLVVLLAPFSAFAQGAVEERLAQIDEIQSLRGDNSPELIEPLSALSLLYEAAGNYELALALIAEATRVIEVNHGLHTLDEGQLLRQSIRIKRARGAAEAAWNEEQELLRLIRRHPYDTRTIPMLQEIADERWATLARYRAGEFPPEIVLGCYYSEIVYDDGLPRRTGCRSGSRSRAIRKLRAEASGYDAAARRLADWAESPCVRPEPKAVESERGSRRYWEEITALDHLLAVIDYTRCMDAKHGLAARAKASPEDLLQLASDRNAAVEELAAQAVVYEERFGFPPKIVDVALTQLRGR